MEFVIGAIKSILQFFGEIFYYFIAFFFFCEPAYTYIYKIALLGMIGFLIHASFRPAKWKWITLFAAESIFIIGAFVPLIVGPNTGSIGTAGYSFVSATWGFIMLVITAICNIFAPFMRKKKMPSDSSPSSTEEAPEN